MRSTKKLLKLAFSEENKNFENSKPVEKKGNTVKKIINTTRKGHVKFLTKEKNKNIIKSKRNADKHRKKAEIHPTQSNIDLKETKKFFNKRESLLNKIWSDLNPVYKKPNKIKTGKSIFTKEDFKIFGESLNDLFIE